MTAPDSWIEDVDSSESSADFVVRPLPRVEGIGLDLDTWLRRSVRRLLPRNFPPDISAIVHETENHHLVSYARSSDSDGFATFSL